MIFIKALFQKTHEKFRYNAVLMYPLLTYLIVALMILMPLGGHEEDAMVEPASFNTVIVILLCIGLITVVFNAGWYNMFLKCVKMPDNPELSKAERVIKSFDLFKEFFPGVALHFLPLLLGTLLYMCLVGILFFGTYTIGVEKIGIPIGVDWGRFIDAKQTYESLQSYINNLAPGILYQMNLWVLLIFAAMIIHFFLNYLTMFWAQIIVYLEVNPVRAFIKSLKLIFAHPLRTLIMNFSFALSLQVCFIVFSIPFILFNLAGMVFYVLIIIYFNLMIFIYLEQELAHNNCGPDSFR